jgi:hypothetical protein
MFCSHLAVTLRTRKAAKSRAALDSRGLSVLGLPLFRLDKITASKNSSRPELKRMTWNN